MNYQIDRWEDKTGLVSCLGFYNIEHSKVLGILGREHFIEEDPSRTHSGTERYWLFKVDKGFLIAFKYFDPVEELFVGSKPDTLQFCKKFIFRIFPELGEIKITSGIMWR